MSKKLLGNLKKGLVFIVSAPAGTGKTTLVQMLLEEFHTVVRSISFTTRLPREGEIEGRDYHFLTESEFKAKIASGDFLEYAQLYGYYYGTSREWVLNQQEKGNHVILNIDTQGALQLKEKLKATFIFIKPPSLRELKNRLTHRKTETAEAIEQRLEWARKEMEAAKEYDYNIINDDLQTAYQILRSILIAEECRVVKS